MGILSSKYCWGKIQTKGSFWSRSRLAIILYKPSIKWNQNWTCRPNNIILHWLVTTLDVSLLDVLVLFVLCGIRVCCLRESSVSLVCTRNFVKAIFNLCPDLKVNILPLTCRYLSCLPRDSRLDEYLQIHDLITFLRE